MSEQTTEKSDVESPEKDDPQPVEAVEEPKADPKNAEKSEESPAAVQVPLTRPAPPAVEPKAEPAEPKAEPAEPKAEPAEPKAEPAEPKAEPAEPKAEPAEPKAETDQPTAESNSPETELDQPESEPAEPEPSEPAATYPSAPAPERPSAAAPTDSPAEQAPEEDADDLAPISSPISRSTRPAWRPMEVRPAARPGVTIFGTRLTYPQAGIGGAVLLVVLVLLIVLAAQAFGSSDNTTPTRPKAAPTATGKPTITGSSTNGGASAGPSSAPSSRPPTSSSPGAFVLPAGWKMYTQRATSNAPAFSIPIPNGTQISGGQGVTVQFRWGPGGHRLLIVDRTDTPQADAFQDLKDKAAAGSNKSGYSFIKIGAVKYRDFDSTADWEYLYNSDAGNLQHVVRRNIRVDAHRAYMLSWYVSPQDWGPGQSDLQTIYQGFQPG
ncbi:hypothetical protein [Actinoplanes subtropicus]|uniref:hypothetical protein n=1 Tax=Actinoplanes subtropicus TaxID=543632 RepID=UPI003CCC3B63